MRRDISSVFIPSCSYPYGLALFKNSVIDVSKCKANWTMKSFINKEIKRIRRIAAPTTQGVGAISGGVDFTITAQLITVIIGDYLHDILIENGAERLNECQDVKGTLGERSSYIC
ncbi:GMP synthase (glutamine-hydrolyzing) [Basidiobolus ranarum]|uniref:GMP synthase (Glutamine-hydrolyzing) n=1 Tax=Basidiobolus ranarum TaxID=34480 RepID=A0ABR2VL61_9FUNG